MTHAQHANRLPAVAAVAAVAALLAIPDLASAQTSAPPPVLGQWDFVVTDANGPYPSWLELTPSGRGVIVGRFVGRVGSSRPIARAEWTDGTLRFAIPPQWEEGTGDLRLEAKLDGERLTGTLTNPDGSRHAFTATRAPSMRRSSPLGSPARSTV